MKQTGTTISKKVSGDPFVHILMLHLYCPHRECATKGRGLIANQLHLERIRYQAQAIIPYTRPCYIIHSKGKRKTTWKRKIFWNEQCQVVPRSLDEWLIETNLVGAFREEVQPDPCGDDCSARRFSIYCRFFGLFSWQRVVHGGEFPTGTSRIVSPQLSSLRLPPWMATTMQTLGL